MFHFDLSEQMTMVIAEALSNHRFKDAAPVIHEIQRQINAQRPSNGGINVAPNNGGDGAGDRERRPV